MQILQDIKTGGASGPVKEQLLWEAVRPLLEDAYTAGLHNEDGYPLNVDAELRAFAEASGKPLERLWDNKLLLRLIWLINAVYAQGREDAAEAQQFT